MTDKELERRLADALYRSAPDDLEGVLSRCEMRKGNVIPMKTKQSSKAWKGLIAACLALVLVGGGGGLFYQQAYAVASVVSLDINPSIELKVNRNEKVLSCAPLNEEAAEILADMGGGTDLKGIKLDVAVNAIVGALAQNGYLDSASSTILISVEDNDKDRASKLQRELTASVDAVLKDQSANVSVLSQTITEGSDLESQARENHISTGKASLINQIIALNGKLKFEKLAGLSVEELKDLLESGAPGMPIGKAAAQQAAEKYAGISDPVAVEVDPELDDTPACYEVELYHPVLGEFEYRVDAFTGKVLSGAANITDSAKTSDQGAVSTADIGQNKAKAIALSGAGLKESQVTGLKVERDRDDGRLEYEVEFWFGTTEYDYTIDGATGKVLKAEREDNSAQSAGSGDIGEDKAKAAAFSHAGVKASQAAWVKVEREQDDGKLKYEVEFQVENTEYDYTIDGVHSAQASGRWCPVPAATRPRLSGHLISGQIWVQLPQCSAS